MKILFIFFVGSQVLGQQVFVTTPYAPASSSFTCHGRAPGYYADLETGCKAYHVCDGHSHFTYICPKRTLFQQRSRICDHSYLVNCHDSPRFYDPETIYADDEEEVLVHSVESEENYLSKGLFEDDFNQTEDFIPTEKPQFVTDQVIDYTITVRAPTTEMTTEEPLAEFTTTNLEQNRASQSIEKFIKFRLKDSRSLFFIPEFKNNSIAVSSEREFLLPLEKNDFMVFRNRKKVSGLFSLCPSHCNPKYFLPGFCHPCIMIK